MNKCCFRTVDGYECPEYITTRGESLCNQHLHSYRVEETSITNSLKVTQLEQRLKDAEEVIAEQSSIIQEVARKFNQTWLFEKMKDSENRQRFFKYVRPAENGCHEWFGYIGTNGYGIMSIDGAPILVHRISCAIHKAQFFDFHVVDHVCKNRICVNPEHLRLVGSRLNAIENSNSKSATNSAKTHCKNGHPLSGENLRLKSQRGGTVFHRQCRTCEKAYKAKCAENKRAREYQKKYPPS